MKNINTLIAVVSWEERFVKGVARDLDNVVVEKLILFQYEGYEQRNNLNLQEIYGICASKKMKVDLHSISFTQPKKNWLTFQKVLTAENVGTEVLVDFSTMPRETIWSVLFFLEQTKCLTDYIYYRPLKYNDEWLSRDPSKPRLLYKMSGISELGLPTMLVVFAGHDYQRLSYLINYIEPHKVVLVSQGNGKNDEVINRCLNEFEGNLEMQTYAFDGLSSEESFEKIAQIVEESFRLFNIVIASLGPKISAIPIYRINRMYPEIALCYVPCKEFNDAYSDGVDYANIFQGTLQIPKRKFELLSEY